MKGKESKRNQIQKWALPFTKYVTWSKVLYPPISLSVNGDNAETYPLELFQRMNEVVK